MGMMRSPTTTPWRFLNLLSLVGRSTIWPSVGTIVTTMSERTASYTMLSPMTRTLGLPKNLAICLALFGLSTTKRANLMSSLSSMPFFLLSLSLSLSISSLRASRSTSSSSLNSMSKKEALSSRASRYFGSSRTKDAPLVIPPE